MLRMRRCLTIVLGLALQGIVFSQPAPVLAINGAVTKSGTQQEYESILRKTAESCRKSGCPQSYLVFSSLSNPSETWVLTSFASREEWEKSYSSQSDLPVLRNQMALRMSYGYFVDYRADLSHGTQWQMGHDQLLIVQRTKNQPLGDGAVFQAGDEFIVITPASSDADAVAAASKASFFPSSRVPAAASAHSVFLSSDVFVAVLRPELSLPAKEWIDADPELWVKPASAKDIRPVIAYDQILH